AAATHFSVGAPSGATAGVGFGVTLTAQDLYGNTATGYTGTVHFTSTDPQAALPANYTFTAADAGRHTFAGVVLRTAGSRAVTATAAGVASPATFTLTNTVPASPPPPPPNTAPTISDVTDRSTPENTSTGAVPFTVGDAETPAGSLTVTAASSNPALIPVSGI